MKEYFNETYDSFYCLQLFAIDDDLIKLNALRRLPITDFFYYVSYKLDKNKLSNK